MEWKSQGIGTLFFRTGSNLCLEVILFLVEKVDCFYDICISNFSKYSFYKGIGNQHLDQGPGPQYDARGQDQDHMKDTEIELDE